VENSKSPAARKSSSRPKSPIDAKSPNSPRQMSATRRYTLKMQQSQQAHDKTSRLAGTKSPPGSATGQLVIDARTAAAREARKQVIIAPLVITPVVVHKLPYLGNR
jgi:hypothetical protein